MGLSISHEDYSTSYMFCMFFPPNLGVLLSKGAKYRMVTRKIYHTQCNLSNAKVTVGTFMYAMFSPFELDPGAFSSLVRFVCASENTAIGFWCRPKQPVLDHLQDHLHHLTEMVLVWFQSVEQFDCREKAIRSRISPNTGSELNMLSVLACG